MDNNKWESRIAKIYIYHTLRVIVNILKFREDIAIVAQQRVIHLGGLNIDRGSMDVRRPTTSGKIELSNIFDYI